MDPPVRREIDIVAPRRAAVLIQGETGVGKELVARMIHDLSGRRGRFVPAQLRETLLEDDLFGHGRGAYTGATGDRAGLVAQAGGGTLFLDEIHALPPDKLSQLLRVLQTKEYRSIGEDSVRCSDFRLVTATNRSLRHEAEAGRFPLDLYYRIAEWVIEIPPLRQRPRELESFVPYLLRCACEQEGIALFALSEAALRRLRAYHWPGNIRELKSILDTAVALARHEARDGKVVIEPAHLRLPDARVQTTLEMGSGLSPYVSRKENHAQVDRTQIRLLEEAGHRTRDICRIMEVSPQRLSELRRGLFPAEGKGGEEEE